MKESGQS